MSKNKTKYQKAVGKLISSIQKEWGAELGESTADMSEDVMGLAHNLLNAGDEEAARHLLGHMTLRQYLGEIWLKKHPNTEKDIKVLEGFLYK